MIFIYQDETLAFHYQIAFLKMVFGLLAQLILFVVGFQSLFEYIKRMNRFLDPYLDSIWLPDHVFSFLLSLRMLFIDHLENVFDLFINYVFFMATDRYLSVITDVYDIRMMSWTNTAESAAVSWNHPALYIGVIE